MLLKPAAAPVEVPLSRALAAEFVGTTLLLAAIVGSGVMGVRLSGGSVALVLLAKSLATGAVLVTLIFTFGSFSGAHFNPLVTLASAVEGTLKESCPVLPGHCEAIHWSFDDPSAATGSEEQMLAVFQRVRDEILRRLRMFIDLDRRKDISASPP